MFKNHTQQKSISTVRCFLNVSAQKDTMSHYFYLIDISPLCVFKRLLILHAQENSKSHGLHLFCFSPMCVLDFSDALV